MPILRSIVTPYFYSSRFNRPLGVLTLTGLIFYILIFYLSLIDESLFILILFALFYVINTGFVKNKPLSAVE